ncbi:hypothetical protein LINPERPRIM_LOCUS17531 [Linum perenne]
MEHLEISLLLASCVSRCDARLGFFFKRLFLGDSRWIPCDNHCYPLFPP